jgi:RHS repeat-associated protein
MTARQQVIRWLGVAAVVLGASPAAGQTVEYYHLDALGSVRALTNQAGQIIERHDYLPFGEEWNPQPSSDARKFTGKERDPETGYDYFGARYLSTKTARFTTVDPLFTLAENLADPQRWNRYSYVRNNPLRYTDPDGRAIDILADIGFIAYDLFDIGRSIYRGDGVGGTQLAALGGDVLGAAVPGVTGIGSAVRAANKIDNVIDASGGAARLVGRADETGQATGIVYRRTDPKTGAEYIGRSKSEDGYLGRQKAHDRGLATKHDYEVIGRATPGSSLRVAEESAIRAGGGPGRLANRRYEMSEKTYKECGGTCGKPNP